MPKVLAVDQNRHHLSIANSAQFRAKIGTGKYFLFVFGQKTKSQLELLYGPVGFYRPCRDFAQDYIAAARRVMFT